MHLRVPHGQTDHPRGAVLLPVSYVSQAHTEGDGAQVPCGAEGMIVADRALKPYYEDEAVQIFHGDCRDILPHLPKVDLVLTDPPYGIGEDSYRVANRGKLAKTTNYGHFDWDTKLDRRTFDLIMGAGHHQIIFGGNYYADWLPPSKCWLVWDKDNNTNDFADCELAWASFEKAVRRIRWRWNGMLQEPGSPKEPRLYPTQKPIPVMRWALSLAMPVASVIDPCMGGGSTLRAAKDMGIRSIGIDQREIACEIAAKRMSQTVMNLCDHKWTCHDTLDGSNPPVFCSKCGTRR